MKKMTALLALAGTTAMAAPQVSVQVRTDYRYDMRNSADSTLKDKNGFDMTFARLDVQGALEQGLKYRMRLRFDNASSAAAKNEIKGASDYVDYAYAKQALPMGFAVTAGKFFSGRAGYEGVTAGADHYLTTMVYDSSGAFHAVVGVQPSWEGAGQTVSLTVANSGVAWKSDKAAQHFLMYGGLWQGTFLEGKVQPHISFYFLPTKAADDGKSLATVGLKSKVGLFTGELEWKMLGDSTKGTQDGDQTQSTSLLAKFDLGMFRPQVKVFHDSKDVLGETAVTRIGSTEILEIYPFEKTNFRWHVGYTNVLETPKGKEDKNWHKVFAGIAMNLDIMK